MSSQLLRQRQVPLRTLHFRTSAMTGRCGGAEKVAVAVMAAELHPQTALAAEATWVVDVTLMCVVLRPLSAVDSSQPVLEL